MSESIRVECSVDFDDEWRQEECHWLCDRFFMLSWKVRETPSVACVAKEFYYRFGPYSTNYNDYNRILVDETTNKVLGTRVQKWTYRLDFDTLLNDDPVKGGLQQLYSAGCITIYMKAKDSNGVVYTAHDTLSYSLELPPDPSINLTIKRKSAEYVICSWEEATASLEVSPVAGYNIELLYCPVGNTEFKPLEGLTTEVDAEGKLKLIKLPDNDSTELYLENPELTSVYFNPRELGFEKGDRYKFVIYPYTHHEGALLSSLGAEAEENKFTLGVVRVKTVSGWVEGQVWIKTLKGWQEAEAVFTNTPDGWKESI